MTLKNEILDISRQNKIGALSPWFNNALDFHIQNDNYISEQEIGLVAEKLTGHLALYSKAYNINTVVLGMSGGVDSAATAALFKRAGYRVVGTTMPINQDPVETERGIEACHALGIEHIHADLSNLYNHSIEELAAIDPEIRLDDKATRIRKGNIRARLRMVTLYNFAAKFGGFVASTDNFSELTAGFWTLHGDVGDVAPIQSLLKSWEVPVLAKIVGVPESTWRATPTDGLGIDAGDEAQLGTTYLEWDLLLLTYLSEAIHTRVDELCKPEIQDELLNEMRDGMNEIEAKKLDAFIGRFRNTSFKRTNPLNFEFPALTGRSIMRIDSLPDIDEAFAKLRGFSKIIR